MPKNNEIDPKIHRKSDKIHDQVDPKWSQNEAKSDTKPKQSPQDAGRPQESDSTAIVEQPRANLEAKIKQKLQKTI